MRGIGSIFTNAVQQIEIDWVEHIPWQYRDFRMLYNRDTAHVHLPDQSYDHGIDWKDVEKFLLGSMHTHTQRRSFWSLAGIWKKY
jgi:hypothetical protein